MYDKICRSQAGRGFYQVRRNMTKPRGAQLTLTLCSGLCGSFQRLMQAMMTRVLPSTDFSFYNAAVLLELQSIYLLTPAVGHPHAPLTSLRCPDPRLLIHACSVLEGVLCMMQGSQHLDFNTGGDFEGRFDAKEGALAAVCLGICPRASHTTPAMQCAHRRAWHTLRSCPWLHRFTLLAPLRGKYSSLQPWLPGMQWRLWTAAAAPVPHLHGVRLSTCTQKPCVLGCRLSTCTQKPFI